MNKLLLEIALWVLGLKLRELGGLLCPTPCLVFGPDAACAACILKPALKVNRQWRHGIYIWISNHARNTDPAMN